ncbi:CD99 antigen [Cebus imitator]|nr:CD99 antigen [Cebus imitator]
MAGDSDLWPSLKGSQIAGSAGTGRTRAEAGVGRGRAGAARAEPAGRLSSPADFVSFRAPPHTARGCQSRCRRRRRPRAALGSVPARTGRTMARGSALALLLLLGLLGALVAAPDNDFDLSDALGDNEDKKPTATPKKPSAGDDFDLTDALGGGGHNDPAPPNPPKPKPNPHPNQPSSTGGFSDADLADGVPGGEGTAGGHGGGSQGKEGEQADAPGVIPGIVGAIVVAVAGAISSFIAYQKKKLCFKENAEQGEVDMESHRNTSAEPAVQRTLLEK